MSPSPTAQRLRLQEQKEHLERDLERAKILRDNAVRDVSRLEIALYELGRDFADLEEVEEVWTVPRREESASQLSRIDQ